MVTESWDKGGWTLGMGNLQLRPAEAGEAGRLRCEQGLGNSRAVGRGGKDCQEKL